MAESLSALFVPFADLILSSDRTKYDVYICYHGDHSTFVRGLQDALMAEGLKVVTPSRLADYNILQAADCMERSRVVLLEMSQAFQASELCRTGKCKPVNYRCVQTTVTVTYTTCYRGRVCQRPPQACSANEAGLSLQALSLASQDAAGQNLH